MNKKDSRKEEIAYVISIPYGHKLEVKKSANAWWMDRQKLEMLIAGFRIGATITLACSYARITEKQYKYFIQIHPLFRECKDGYEAEIQLKARQTIVKAIYEGNVKIAMRYLERKLPEEFGRPSRLEREQLTREQKMAKISELLDEEEKSL